MIDYARVFALQEDVLDQVLFVERDRARHRVGPLLELAVHRHRRLHQVSVFRFGHVRNTAEKKITVYVKTKSW